MSIKAEAPLTASRLAVPPLPDVMLEPLVRAALLEDLGRAGDLTTDAIVPHDAVAETRLVSRQAGVLAGLDLARLAFRAMDPTIEFHVSQRDGSDLAPGTEIARLRGNARAMLTAERVALNFLCHLSGVASATASIARAISGYGARHLHPQDHARPARRAKYAVRVGAAAITGSGWTTRC